MNKVLQGIKEASEKVKEYKDYVDRMYDKYSITIGMYDEQVLTELDDERQILLEEDYVFYYNGNYHTDVIDFNYCEKETTKDFYNKIKEGIIKVCKDDLQDYEEGELSTEELLDLIKFIKQLEDKELSKTVDTMIEEMKKDIKEKEKLLDNLKNQ